MKPLAALLVAVCVLGHARAVSATWIFDTDVGVLYDSNVGLGKLGRDIHSDTALNASVSAGRAMQIDDRNVVSLTGDVNGTAWDRFSGLNNVSLGLTTAFRSKLGVGPEVPWVRIAGSAARQEYDIDVRDGWRYRLGGAIGKRFGERWDVRADYAFDKFLADHDRAVTPLLPGDVFDVTSHTFSGRAVFLYNEAISLAGGYALREGDVVATTRRNPQIFAASSALTTDRAFGHDTFAYKIDATTHILSAGLSVVLGPRSSLNLGYERQIGAARRGIDYYNDVVRFRFLYSY